MMALPIPNKSSYRHDTREDTAAFDMEESEDSVVNNRDKDRARRNRSNRENRDGRTVSSHKLYIKVTI